MSYRTKQGLIILMAEDSEEDVMFVKRALERSQVGNFFHSVPDGSQALAYLRGQGPYANRQEFPFPNVLLCDLKMPGMNGLDVLRWLRDHPDCRVIPTIIFSSSAMEADVHQSYVLGANAYIEKPSSLEDFTSTIQFLYQFWSRCQVPLPPLGERCS